MDTGHISFHRRHSVNSTLLDEIYKRRHTINSIKNQFIMDKVVVYYYANAVHCSCKNKLLVKRRALKQINN